MCAITTLWNTLDCSTDKWRDWEGKNSWKTQGKYLNRGFKKLKPPTSFAVSHLKMPPLGPPLSQALILSSALLVVKAVGFVSLKQELSFCPSLRIPTLLQDPPLLYWGTEKWGPVEGTPKMGPGLRCHLDYMQHVACLEVMLGKPFLKSYRLVNLTFRRRVILLRLLLFYYALSTLTTKTCDESKVKSKSPPPPSTLRHSIRTAVESNS